MIDPSQVRAVPRDGAMLFFDRADGSNVLVRSPSTQHLRARAPRVVMFGITNACNLRCSFCSRDLEAASAWDEESAFEMLSALSRAGVLEVALGGGEPLAFRGIESLLARLHESTSLAVHLTTNAVLLDDARLARIRPHVGEIRVSIYDDNPWPERIAALSASGGSFGANVLVTPDRVAALPALLTRLEALGCPDVALLRYVGPDAALSLGRDDTRRVAEVAASTSMRVRASVCFGATLGLPMLDVEAHGDCGAGSDFVVVTSDRTLRACSFGRDSIPFERADEVITAWRQERDRLSAPVALYGCARNDGTRALPTAHGVRAWRAFSGNNSGDCFLVGKFERAADAEALVSSLREGHAPGESFSEAWRARLAAEGIVAEAGEYMPDALEVVGRNVIAHTQSAAEDDFPSLRALLWKLGGRAVGTGVHEHDPVHLVTALAIDDAAKREQIDVRTAIDDLGSFVTKGEVLYAVRALPHSGLHDALAFARSVVADGGLASAELIAESTLPPLARALASRPPAPGVEWLTVFFEDADRAAAFARELGPSAAACDRFVVVRAAHVPSHHGARATRAGGGATVIQGEELALQVSLWHPSRSSKQPFALDLTRLESELRIELGHEATLEGPFTESWHTASASLRTRAPLTVLPFLAAFASGRGLEIWLEMRSPRPLEDAIARIDVDLAALRRERRAR